MSVAVGGVPESDWQKRGAESGSETEQSGSTTGGSLDQQPVVVWEAANQMEALVVKGRLESEGIPAIIAGEVAGLVFGLTVGGLAAAHVLVPAALADEALQILCQEEREEEREEETSS